MGIEGDLEREIDKAEEQTGGEWERWEKRMRGRGG